MGRKPIVLAVAFKNAQFDWANYPNPEDVGNAQQKRPLDERMRPGRFDL